MCVIIHNPEAKEIPSDILDNCERINKDGFGITFLRGKRETVKTMDYKEARKLLSDGRPYVAHYRYTTKGKTCEEMNHPFQVVPTKAAGKSTYQLYMNGTISSLGDSCNSDTSELADVLRTIPSRHWKTVFRLSDARFAVVNESTGNVVKTGLWVEKDGVWYSKDNVLKAKSLVVHSEYYPPYSGGVRGGQYSSTAGQSQHQKDLQNPAIKSVGQAWCDIKKGWYWPYKIKEHLKEWEDSHGENSAPLTHLEEQIIQLEMLEALNCNQDEKGRPLSKNQRKKRRRSLDLLRRKVDKLKEVKDKADKLAKDDLERRKEAAQVASFQAAKEKNQVRGARETACRTAIWESYRKGEIGRDDVIGLLSKTDLPSVQSHFLGAETDKNEEVKIDKFPPQSRDMTTGKIIEWSPSDGAPRPPVRTPNEIGRGVNPYRSTASWKGLHVIAVYGTLKKGFGNHAYFMNGSEVDFLGYGETQSCYSLDASGGVPFLYDDSHVDSCRVQVELYLVKCQLTREAIDGLEGHPRNYERKIIKVRQKASSGSETVMVRQAWVYFGNPRGLQYPFVRSSSF